jgi:hypothetical protein
MLSALERMPNPLFGEEPFDDEPPSSAYSLFEQQPLAANSSHVSHPVLSIQQHKPQSHQPQPHNHNQYPPDSSKTIVYSILLLLEFDFSLLPSSNTLDPMTVLKQLFTSKNSGSTNPKVFEAVAYFLFHKLDPERTKEVSEGNT